MKLKMKAKVVLVGLSSLAAIIPKQIANEIKLKKGDTVLVSTDGKKITIEKEGERE